MPCTQNSSYTIEFIPYFCSCRSLTSSTEWDPIISMPEGNVITHAC